MHKELIKMQYNPEQLVKEILKTENKNSFIKEPIHEGCKLVVSLPVYDEQPASLLLCLSSLAKEEGISVKDFEVVIVVNNNTVAAKNKTKEYLNNQQILNLIYFLLGNEKLKFKLSAQESEMVKNIVDSKINIRVINKSSVECAYEENYVAIARNRAAAEIYERFKKTKIKDKGIIVIADCDNIFSPNFVTSIISTFEKYNVNACSGRLQFYFGNDIKNLEVMKKVLPIFLNRPLTLPISKKIIVQNSKEHKPSIISCCPNLSVNIKAYFQAGGFPNRYSAAGTVIVENLSKLPGSTCVNLSYSVGYEIRSSERCGMFGFGRTVSYIEKYVDNYTNGRVNKIMAPDYKLMKDFMIITTALRERDRLNKSNLLKVFKELNIIVENLPNNDIDGFLKAAKKDDLLDSNKIKFKNMEKFAIDHFFDLFTKEIKIKAL